jgi:ornithine carbamoyltransferase
VLADLLVMQEHAGRPAAEITLGLLDDPDSEAFRSWQLASALTGLRLVRLEPPAHTPLAASGPACDYCFQAAPSGGTGSTLRVASTAAGGGGEDLARRQHDAHRRLLQSVLVNATG